MTATAHGTLAIWHEASHPLEPVVICSLRPGDSSLPRKLLSHIGYFLTRLTRLNDPLLRVWDEILHRVPNSRLRLDQKTFVHVGTRVVFWQRLEGLGIARDRVDLTCSSPHWDTYRKSDIALDCWPYNAGTTTNESFWMVVLVLSKMDRPLVGRISGATLKPLGLKNWLVETAEAYIGKAILFASGLDGLSELRAVLRDRVDQGPHLDAATVTGYLENAYLEMIKALEGRSHDAIGSGSHHLQSCMFQLTGSIKTY